MQLDVVALIFCFMIDLIRFDDDDESMSFVRLRYSWHNIVYTRNRLVSLLETPQFGERR